MTKELVVYYSKTGSNRLLANKIAMELDCNMEEIKPKISLHLLMVFGFNPGIKKLKADLITYDRIILAGPIWMGKFVSPLKSFVKKYAQSIKNLVFVTCCGSSYEAKDKKFGHNLVFKQVNELLGDKCSKCVALPIPLILPDDKKEDADAVMKTRLTEGDFKGEIADRFDALIKDLKN